MPQIFQVLRCYKCSVFQVHQTRKDNKWVCKLCGEKQSVKRHYGIGTSRDCRTHVQKLNKMRAEKDEVSMNIIDSEDSECDENVDNSSSNVCDTKTSNGHKESKWSVYIDKVEQNDEISEPVYLNDREVVLEIPQKRKINTNHRQIKYSKKLFDNEENCKIYFKNHLENQIDSIGISPTNYNDSASETFVSDNQEVCLKSKIKLQINTLIDKVPHPKQRLHIQQQKVYKGSKWAQFLEPEESDENDDKNTEKNCNKQPLFSLCDDSEIDTILDL